MFKSFKEKCPLEVTLTGFVFAEVIYTVVCLSLLVALTIPSDINIMKTFWIYILFNILSFLALAFLSECASWYDTKFGKFSTWWVSLSLVTIVGILVNILIYVVIFLTVLFVTK